MHVILWSSVRTQLLMERSQMCLQIQFHLAQQHLCAYLRRQCLYLKRQLRLYTWIHKNRSVLCARAGMSFKPSYQPDN